MYISEEEKASVSSILPILYGIIENLSITDGDSAIIKEFKRKVTESIEQRWSLDNLCPVLALSAVLDARFKQLKFLEDTKKSAVIDALKSNVEILAEGHDCTSQQQVENEATSSSTMDSFDPPVAKRSKASALDILLGPEESLFYILFHASGI